MKKFAEILEDIKRNGAEIVKAEEREKKLIDKYMSAGGISERSAARKAVESDLCKNAESIKDRKITAKILKSNARIALYHEAVPVVLEVLEKYKGKPYGEKTKDKISNEIKEKTGCRFYISVWYSSYEYHLYPMNIFGTAYDLEFGAKYKDGKQAPLLVGNKIQVLPENDLEPFGISREYVEDIPRRIADLKSVYAEALQKQQELGALCSRYNALAVGEIEHLYKDKRIYENMSI